jgi:hypothetical protein
MAKYNFDLGLFSATATGVLFDIATDEYPTLSLQVTSVGVGGAFVVEESNDGTTWYAITGASGVGLGIYAVPLSAKRVRVRVSAYTSGTVAAFAVLKKKR